MTGIALRFALLLMASTFFGLGCQRTNPDSSDEQESPPQSTHATDESAEVKEAFASFSNALKRQEGDLAASLVSDRTLDLYERCRTLAINSADVDFEGLSQLEVMLVFQLRYLLTRHDLESMNAKEVFSWGVREGLVKQDSVEGISLDRIQVDGDVALATTKKNGKPSPNDLFRFINENASWKFDLSYLFMAMEPAFAEVRNQAGKSKVELAVFSMERSYGRAIPFEILNGPLK